jgi:hypothetical protein
MTTAPSPTAERAAPTRSIRGRSPAGASAIEALPMSRTAAIGTSAANTQRQLNSAVTNPPMIGPAAIAAAAAAAMTRRRRPACGR